MRYYFKSTVALLLAFSCALFLLNLFYTRNYKASINPWQLLNSIVHPDDQQQQQQQQTQQPGETFKKYIIYECNNRQLCGGLVDRFKAVIDAYAWAQFTDRTLILNISKPCYFEYLMMPNEINWNLNLKQLVENGDLPANYSLHELRRLDSFGFKDELAKIDVLNYYNTIDVISLYTNLEWISAYARNEYLKESIEKLGFAVNEFHFSTVFNKWCNKLFKLHPDIEKKFQPYLDKAKPSPSTPLVCVQVRVGGARPNVAYDRNITPRNFSVHYWDFIRNNLTQGMNDFRMFVTADTESVEEEAVKEFGTEKVVVIEGVSAHVDREANFRENCTRFDKIVMDFWMLGNCDMALVSDSGFGIFGILRTKIPEENFYVLSALTSGLKKPDFFKLKKFIHSNPHRY